MALYETLFLCLWCDRFDGHESGYATCKAYPYGIPTEITSNRWDHREPLPDDRGLAFLPSESYPSAVAKIDRALSAARNPS